MSKKFMIWESNPFYTEETLEQLKIELDMGELDNEKFLEVLQEQNEMCYEDEVMNLDITLPENMIVIADIGHWNGRKQGYKIENNVVNRILIPHVKGDSDFEVYGDGYNIVAQEHHHDGTNHYLYRVLRENVNHQPLLDAIYSGEEISSAMLNRYTRSLYPYVAAVYGWPCRQKLACKM